MKKLFSLLFFLLLAIQAFPQPDKPKLMPVTSNSKSALSYYSQAMKYLDDVKLKEALGAFNNALEQDKDFFMANVQLAFFYILNRDRDNFDKYSEAAINCKVKLNGAEELLKQALVRLQQGKTDVIDLGKKLLEMYPTDPASYNSMVYFQSLAGDSTGMVETLNRAIKITTHPATFYNQLGYAYLTLMQIDKAEEAFDKYIELDPKNPNVYDSKGDYFMYIKKYDKAYELYMTAYSMDHSYSHNKAQMAKQLYEHTEGRKLDIITM